MLLVQLFLTLFPLLLPTVIAETLEFNWTLSSITANPDGKKERPVIAINDAFPLPVIRIKQNDRVIINLRNNLKESTSLHFHGIFQKGTSYMDGASMITQCPIPPGESFQYDFTVDQVGTFWYHSHDAAQYGDGLRGALIVEPLKKGEYEDDFVVMLSDWYHTPSSNLVEQLFSVESQGSEPRIDSWLFNETRGTDITVEKDKTYLIRLINVGMSASQYFYIDDHKLTIVEIDGVEVEPTEIDTVKLATGQRVAVLLNTKEEGDTNYGVVQATNMMMRKEFGITRLVYDKDAEDKKVTPDNKRLKLVIDDIELKPKGEIRTLGKPDHELIMEYGAEYYTPNRIRYYPLNGQPHFAPKVPTLNTVFSANSSTVDNPVIYGQATNALLLKKGEVVQVVVNSNDHMRHPFHLHGHNFQVLARGARAHFDNHTDGFLEYPMVRDTVEVPGRGHVVLRFVADNPGVWFFHCHTEWHAVQGLGVVFVEAPEEILEKQRLPTSFEDICNVGGIRPRGNAAGNIDLLDLEGEIKLPEKYRTEMTPVTKLISTTTPNPTTHTAKVETTKAETHKATPTTTTTRKHHGMKPKPRPTPTPTPSPTKKPDPEMATFSLKQQGKVLAVYFLIMITVACIAAYYVNRGNLKHKRRLLRSVNLRDDFEMQSSNE